MDGYEYPFREEKTILTVWSAPNYCYRNGNKATTCTFKDNRKIFKVFKETDHETVVPLENVVPYFL